MREWKKIDMESWPRRDHFIYYTEKLKVQYLAGKSEKTISEIVSIRSMVMLSVKVMKR